MSHETHRILREQHQVVTLMLRTMGLLLAEHRRCGTPPDFGVLRAMLFYLDEFHGRLHQTKESELLFPSVRARTDEQAEVFERLDRDHELNEYALRELQHMLLAFEVLGTSRRDAFEQALERYTDAYLAHVRIEEEVILPLALRVLTEADWSELDSAFAANRDPLTGQEPDEAYRRLFSQILDNLPAPLGLGAALA